MHMEKARTLKWCFTSVLGALLDFSSCLGTGACTVCCGIAALRRRYSCRALAGSCSARYARFSSCKAITCIQLYTVTLVFKSTDLTLPGACSLEALSLLLRGSMTNHMYGSNSTGVPKTEQLQAGKPAALATQQSPVHRECWSFLSAEHTQSYTLLPIQALRRCKTRWSVGGDLLCLSLKIMTHDTQTST